MQIGEVIRKYRKARNLTQEEMASRLGVTAPAVNKWENGNSLPDITLLAPIARLLDITLDTLLSYRENLTAEEINHFVRELDERFKKENYGEVFRWAKHMLEQYPNCEQLLWQAAVILDVRRLTQLSAGQAETELSESEAYEEYENYIYSCYVRALDSKDEDIRRSAADSLFGWHMRKEEYESAREYMKYFPKQDPVKKLRQAELYARTGQIPDAYRESEELLFSNFQTVNAALYRLYTLAIQEGDMEKASVLADKAYILAGLFEMGDYHGLTCRLDLAAAREDAETAINIMEKLLSAADGVYDFSKSRLYEHMSFKEPDEGFSAQIRENLLKFARKDERFAFLKDNARWQALTAI